MFVVIWSTLKKIFRIRKTLFAFLIPLLLIPIPAKIGTPEAKCAYVLLLMACFWLMEIMPLAVTALIPVVFLPLFGILSTDETCKIYMKEINMIFLGSLIAATAVEHCNLHNRLALRILLLVGTSPRWLMLGFMLTTVLLVSVIPMEKMTDRKLSMASVTTDPIEQDSRSKEEKNLRKALFMGVCYSANIGGTGTLTGTTPNLILKGQIDDDFKDYSKLTFASWMLFNIPGTILCVILAWAWLQILFMRQCGKDKKNSNDSVKTIIEKNYKDLGSITFHEAAVLVLFIILLILWFCRDPGFMPGWGVALSGEENKTFLKDAIPAIAIVLLLFVIPARPMEPETSPPLLEWKIAQQNVSWGVILLLGGGFALAEGTTRSGLSFWLGDQLAVLQALSAEVVVLIVCLIALTLTEVASNTATATIMMPVLSNLAEAVGIHPIKIMMPVAMCCSYAFILPVATAPNAIVFEAAPLTQTEMALPGFIMKLLCLSVSMLMIHTIGNPIFKMDVPISTNSTLGY
ncbi:solute carrier family 13 member 5-like [Limulus polyphemus]|uniref:Solute carrier family 13 member 5-like n=1 Tax=Limulus polyphemus TaxID=6850 RepID=A0ABM1T8S9_LIMPO|nr:solute carrier family 13 member 5-like [Limulus polyphemus]